MGTNYGLKEAILRKGIFLEASKVLVAIMLDARREQEERKSNGGLQGWFRKFQEACR
jgi:hypothetical protein